MGLFHYPKIRHARTKSPPQYKNYRSYKPYLREEFEKTCVYCRKPDGLAELDSFGVDHYKPKDVFPSLVADYSNLFYSCNTCNRLKGTFWPDSLQLKAGQFVPNPCDHIMFEHLRAGPGCIVNNHSIAGQWTIDLLLLNEPDRMEFRRAIVVAVEACRRAEMELLATIDIIERKIAAAFGESRNRLLDARRDEEGRLADIRRSLKRLTGES